MRVENAELSGGPNSEDLFRCAVALYNDGSSVTSHFYDIIANPNYRIGPPFPFHECYDFLSTYTHRLGSDASADGIDTRYPGAPALDDASRTLDFTGTETPANTNTPGTGTDVPTAGRSIPENANESRDGHAEPVVQLGSRKAGDRPEGVKRAKKKKNSKSSGTDSLQDGLESIADSSLLMSKAYQEAQEKKISLSSERLELSRCQVEAQENRNEVDMLQMLLAPGAPTTDEQRKTLTDNLFKRLSKSTASTSAPHDHAREDDPDPNPDKDD